MCVFVVLERRSGLRSEHDGLGEFLLFCEFGGQLCVVLLEVFCVEFGAGVCGGAVLFGVSVE